MKQFEPSEYFIENTMKKVQTCKQTKERFQFPHTRLSAAILRYSILSGGVILGLFNIIRLYTGIFAPSICQ
jgi:hypothetical protein